MEKSFRHILKTFVPKYCINSLKILEWRMTGCPIPPPDVVKQLVIRQYQKKYKYSTLIETGTYRGDMVEAQKNIFSKIISIELSPELFEKAQSKFLNNSNVFIINGDSGKVLPEVLKKINEPVIFWLDGHYSGGVTAKGGTECPIMEELNAIFTNVTFDHVLLIDDARLFTGEKDYPTIDELTDYILSRSSRYKVDVKHDIIRFEI